MKNLSALLFIILLFMAACSKKETHNFEGEREVKMNYDTTAIDSFSDGATSVDIVRQIRMSSQKYKDSLVQAKKLQDEEARLKAELEKENKKTQEEEKKKADAEKKQKEAASPAAEVKTQ
ncbi:hypothetical protein [Chryseobacterium indologenes]|uniref:Lipoprotein n=1 Tax=Chryseobacterium indologenes TaxID=253 RepID=A0A0N0IVF0_CHRID|nr:hypothetical protein [Chryseobacterium indologenes]KPE50473.1 hypothetical protein AOB46_13850 [Chryseobacterium indologenes]